MLARFEVRDLPLLPTLVVEETSAVKHALDLVGARAMEVVVVLHRGGDVRGVLEVEALRRLAQTVPDAAVGLLPTVAAESVPPSTTLLEALRRVTAPGLGALLVWRADAVAVAALTRAQLLALEDFEELERARQTRLGARTTH
jgi:predicted transcriptional regulator